MAHVREEAREVPVLDEVDVLVAGGGISGCTAALAAARAGAKTVLLERNGCLGGVATATLMASIGNFMVLSSGEQVVRGIGGEIVERLVGLGAASRTWRRCKAIPLDSERLKVVLIEMLEEAGVAVLTHALAVRPIQEGDAVRGCFFESKSGRQAILAKNTVDATGDLDLVAQTGAQVITHRGNASLLFKMTGCDLDRFVAFLGEDPEGFPDGVDRVKDYAEFARTWHEDGVLLFPHYGGKKWRFMREAVERGDFHPKVPPAFNLDVLGMYALRANNHIVINSTYYIFEVAPNAAGLDIRDLSHYETHAQRMCYYVGDFLRRKVPGFEGARVEQLGVDLGLRGARRLVGRFTLEERHIRGEGDAVRFDDVIGTWPVRRQSKEGGEVGTPVFADETFDVPFGILVPRGATHVLSGSGRSVSTGGGHKRLVRGMSGCMIVGQAAGVAAALGARNDCSAGEVAVRDIQRELLRQGVRLGPPERLNELGLASSDRPQRQGGR